MQMWFVVKPISIRIQLINPHLLRGELKKQHILMHLSVKGGVPTKTKFKKTRQKVLKVAKGVS